MKSQARSYRRSTRAMRGILGVALALFLAQAALPGGVAEARRASIHAHYYGYIQDRAPARASVIHIWSKKHHAMYRILMTPATVIHEHGVTVPRATLAYGQYVIVTCTDRSSTCTALRVSIVIRHHRAKPKH